MDSKKLLPGCSGYVIVRNAIRGDYAPILSALSLLPVCDEVVLADGSSDDGTLELLTDFAASQSKVRVIRIPWPALPTFDEWAKDAPRPPNDNMFWPKLINVVRPMLRFSHQLHLDADEVLFPCAYDEVRRAVAEGGCRWLRRINFWQDVRHQVPEGHVCGTNVARLGPTDLWMPSDECHPEGEPEMRQRAGFHSDLLIGHLGFLRKQDSFFQKSRVMQVAVAGTYDPRLIEAEKTGADWWTLSRFDAPLQPYYGPIPELIRPWLMERGRIPEVPLIVHLSIFMGLADGETARRMGTARDSWEREYSAHPGEWNSSVLSFVRDSRSVGEEQPVPFVRDMIAQGIGRFARNENDIIFLTNADVGFAKGLTHRLGLAVKAHGAVYLRRAEFAEIRELPSKESIENADRYPGGDGFAFTVKWWAEHGAIFPDMLLGRYGWDSAMKNLIRRAGGQELDGELFHESHTATWNATPEAIETNAGNAHNRRLLTEWLSQFGGSAEDHLYSIEELKYR